MKKQFVYQVGAFEFVDTEAFGTAWKEAKAKATELHTAIYRQVIKGENIQNEVFYEAGFFNALRFMDSCEVKIF